MDQSSWNRERVGVMSNTSHTDHNHNYRQRFEESQTKGGRFTSTMS